MLAEVPQVEGEVVRRVQGVRVVFAEIPAEPGQDFLVQLAGRLINRKLGCKALRS